jgi:NADH:ubiquinone oxidoreductase subunit E
MAKLIIEVCLGTSCHLMGSQAVMSAIETLPPEQKAQVDLRGVTCLQNCRKGPTVRINGVVLTEMTPDRLLAVIEDSL